MKITKSQLKRIVKEEYEKRDMKTKFQDIPPHIKKARLADEVAARGGFYDAPVQIELDAYEAGELAGDEGLPLHPMPAKYARHARARAEYAQGHTDGSLPFRDRPARGTLEESEKKESRKMKITKSQLKQIIKEETAAVLNENDDWFDKEHETMADRKFADRPEDPDDDSDDAAELEAGLDLTGFELTKDRGFYFIVDKESGERVLGPFRTEGQAEERAARPDTRSEFEAAQDVLDRLR